MTTLLDRVKQLMEDTGTNAKQLTAELGISNSSFTDWGKGKGKPSLETVTKFSEYFNVSMDYLVFGKSASSSKQLDFSNSKDMELLDKYHTLTPELQDRLTIYLDGMIAAMPSQEQKDSEKRLSV